MRRPLIALVGALAAAFIVSLVPVLVVAQAPTTKAGATMRTPWGDPDLQGVWDGQTTTPLQRPDKGAKAVLTDEEAEAAAEAFALSYEKDFGGGNEPGNQTGSYNAFWKDWGTPLKGRTELIVDPPDGKLPPFTPEAQKARAAAANAGPGRNNYDDPENLGLGTRCVFWAGTINGGSNQLHRIVQTPGYLTINSERNHENRVIPLDGRPHVSQSLRQWAGDPVGHWEGATLVVDSTNYTNKAPIQGSDQNLHVVERFTRVDARTINYQVTLEDPTVWTRPWTLALPLKKNLRDESPSAGVYEYACHEGNYGLVGILGGARAQEAKGPARPATK